ncbi:MAG: response regulator transcription factor, partial [bacterium]|nr:response regulator transcription factor [bacterium]
MDNISILIVDDEQMVLDSIRSFLELETEFNVLTSTSPVKALEILGQNDIEVIITDYLMPVMNGIEF